MGITICLIDGDKVLKETLEQLKSIFIVISGRVLTVNIRIGKL